MASSAPSASESITAAVAQLRMDDAAIAVSSGRPQPITSSPQIVENTLKEFYEYLQFLKDRLQRHQQRELKRNHNQVRSIASNSSSSSDEDSDSEDDGDLNNPKKGRHDHDNDPTITTTREEQASLFNYWNKKKKKKKPKKKKASNHQSDGEGQIGDARDDGEDTGKHEQQQGDSDDNDGRDNNDTSSQVSSSSTGSVWTFDRDTVRYLQHLAYFKDKILEQIDRFPLHSQAGREILEAIQSAASRGSAQHLGNPSDVLRHVRQMALYVSRLLQEIQLVDLDLLIRYMAQNQHAGNLMAGKDVLLLCGAARAGKTTTLHFLAGSTLQEVEIDGFFHIQPTAVKDESLANYATASTIAAHAVANNTGTTNALGMLSTDREPVTNHLQTAQVKLPKTKQTVIICDTPGLGPHDDGLSSQSVEWDIANGLGMIRAIHRAKTVKPIWVINRDEVSFRERFTSSALDGETVAAMKRLMSKSPEPLDLGPFNYLFTKYEAKHREVLCRQFAVMRKNYSSNHYSTASNPNNANHQQDNTNNSNHPSDLLLHPISYQEVNQKMNNYSTGSNNNLSSFQHNSSLTSSNVDDHTFATGGSAANTATSVTTQNQGKNRRWMKKVLEDITKKTTPRAHVVLPLEDDPAAFLQQLWDDCATVSDPKRFFVPFVTYPALKKLQLQLRITLSDLRTSLVEEDQTTAVYRLRQLQSLAQVLPEATDCANLGVEAVKKHMLGLRSRVLASIERRDYSMAIHRAQQLVTLSVVLPEAKTYGTITHDAVVLLRDLISALQATDYKTCQDRMTKLSELAREFPEANKCAHFALQASISHVSEFRDRVIKLIDTLLDKESTDPGKEGTKKFTSMLETLNTELANVVSSEPLLLLCVKEDYIGLDMKEERAMKDLARCTSEAFCIDQVARLTDNLRRDIPNFQSSTLNRDELLKRREFVLTALERLKICSVHLNKSPAGARADSIYHQAFKSFHDLVSSILAEAEQKYKSTWTDLDVFGRKVWFVAVLLQGPLKNKPHTARREHSKIEDLERRVLKVMLRLEIEVKRSMDRLKNFKFPDCGTKAFLKHTPIPDFGVSELKAPRFLLISVSKNARIRKLLPSKLDVLELNVCIAMFDHALLAFWRKVVIRLEQDYAVVVAMQKTQKDPQEILEAAKQLRTDVGRVEKEFLGVCGWSDDITTESEADLKRLIAVRDCVHMGVRKMEEMAKTKGRGLGFFACGNLNTVDSSGGGATSTDYLCRPKVPDGTTPNEEGNNKDSSNILCQPKAAPE
ncbi:expressed unknown protein [Seminavis robusta]|uniref:Uncharacterized protein n=1 Tax=Seminavis robusta TaxID=568900 RepID=A0A9N8E7B1_9STRA|nr:expressed unknown protein [Seminavis robusta]|eukprot:Sro728_g193750.1 n/a (1268) ;mRNA; r:40512-44315